MDNRVRLRYAPSPTGNQHIGGIRTALFNYLYAKANHGDFILRIEDTDQKRYFEEALEDIIKTFKWLGIDYDEGPFKEGRFGPYFQSQRISIYAEYAEKLVKKGAAYYCFCDEERLSNMRQDQETQKTEIGYDRKCRDLSINEIEELKKKNSKPVIRLKVPLQGKTVFHDVLAGDIEFDNSILQDFILLKSDGYPTYHLANIIDDHLMEITHVLRAQEWIPSTPNHILLYRAFDWQPPIFCHLPMVMGEDGRKLSKRHGATHVNQFIEDGYLKEALINFVVLLGWSYNDKDEIFSLEELKKIFMMERINKSSAIFNYNKLKWFNGQYIRKKSVDELLKLVIPYFIKENLIKDGYTSDEKEKLKKIIPLIQERIELLSDAPEVARFLYGDLPQYKNWDDVIPKKVESTTVVSVLNDAKEILKELNQKPSEELQHKLYDLAQKYNVKAGAIFMPLRIAITGSSKSPELFPAMEILGYDIVNKRLEYALNRLQNK